MSQDKAKTYAKVMVEMFEGQSEAQAKEKARRLRHLLHKRGDIKHASNILQEFAKAWKERKGKSATIVTAQPLQSQIRKDLEKSLAKKKYVFEEKIDPSVIGGIALFLGNEYVVDSTIRGKLQRLAKSLKIETLKLD